MKREKEIRKKIWQDIKKARLFHYRTYFTVDGEQVRELLKEKLKKIIIGNLS